MRFKATEIMFDGKRASDIVPNKRIWFATSERDLYKESFAGQREIIETRIPGREQPYFHRVDYSPLEFSFILAFEEPLTEEEVRKVYKWLFKENYKELKFGDWEEGEFQEKIFYTIFTGSPKIFHTFDGNKNINGYIKLKARCNSSTGFIVEEIESDSFTIDNTYGVLPVLYHIEGLATKSKVIIGEIEIDEIHGKNIKINNNAKVIKSEDGDNIYPNWNKKWIEVQPGEQKEIDTEGFSGLIKIYKPVFL